MGQILDKRTKDARYYDIDCSFLLSKGETISSVTSITADQGGLVFGAASPNGAAVTYSDGRTVPIGQVAQVQISGGVIPTGQPFLICIVRALLLTSLNPAVEATVLLRLVDTPNI